MDMDHNAIETFGSYGVLYNTTISDEPMDGSIGLLFAISRDLGTIRAMQDPIVWAIGYTTDPAISYTTQSGSSQQRSPYYKSQYTDDESLVTSHMFREFIVLTFRFRSLTL